ncbi:MAG: TIGR00730 family Rossman fold protein [Rubrobacter sp.]|nr:TIGR00730 family Rossman fold protein [Rubrobacter sp.]MBA3790058.1 TIGR00730 family Rossman fold protein [Rubrobacter sp.]
MNSICVFCGSRPGTDPAYEVAARCLGQALAQANITLVYGGGNVGLMGVVADAALEAGGEVVGVIPEALMRREIGHPGLTKLHVVASMHERKAKMAELSDGFVALPGGTGTLEEFFEVLTWAQLGEHEKPCGLLDIAGYYGPLLAVFDHMVEKGFLKDHHREMLLLERDPTTLLERFARYEPPRVAKWIDESET